MPERSRSPGIHAETASRAAITRLNARPLEGDWSQLAILIAGEYACEPAAGSHNRSDHAGKSISALTKPSSKAAGAGVRLLVPSGSATAPGPEPNRQWIYVPDMHCGSTMPRRLSSDERVISPPSAMVSFYNARALRMLSAAALRARTDRSRSGTPESVANLLLRLQQLVSPVSSPLDPRGGTCALRVPCPQSSSSPSPDIALTPFYSCGHIVAWAVTLLERAGKLLRGTEVSIVATRYSRH